jgi:branched-chain amino acid transport system permease protein
LTLIDRILQFIISGATTGSVYAMVGLAIATIYNVTRIFDVSQGQYVILGAMLVCFFRAAGFNAASSIALALSVSLILGLFIWRIVFYGPSKKYPTMTLIMITVGVAMLIEGVIFLALGTDVRTTPYYFKIAPIRIFKATVSPQAPFIYGAIVLMVFGLSFLFSRTLLGKGLRACHEQPLAARLMGINIQKMMYFSFMLAIFLGTIGGIIMVPLTAASYNMGMDLVIKGFLAALVGGISKSHGVIIGGLALGLLESFSAGFISSSYAMIISLTVFVAALLFRPTGLMGSEEIRT